MKIRSIVAAVFALVALLGGGAFVTNSSTPPSSAPHKVGAYSPKALDIQIASQAQGDTLYFNGTIWTRLAAGTSGQFLKTQGASANPTWTPPTSTDLSIGSQAQGDILYFNGTNWTRLAASTAGNLLRTNGTGANPSWISPNNTTLLTSIPVDLLTAPPVASNWPALYGGPAAATDITGGVQVSAASSTGPFVYSKTLASPGGSHVSTFFLSPEILPANTSDTVAFGIVVVGSTNYSVVDLEYSGGSMVVVAQRLTNAAGAFGANLNFPFPGYTTAPYVPSWWRVTYDATNIKVEVAPIGSVYATILGTTAHGCGATQSIGVSVRGGSTAAKLNVFSYVE